MVTNQLKCKQIGTTIKWYPTATFCNFFAATPNRSYKSTFSTKESENFAQQVNLSSAFIKKGKRSVDCQTLLRKEYFSVATGWSKWWWSEAPKRDILKDNYYCFFAGPPQPLVNPSMTNGPQYHQNPQQRPTLALNSTGNNSSLPRPGQGQGPNNAGSVPPPLQLQSLNSSVGTHV